MLMSIGAGPTALTMHIACGSGVKQNQPWDIAMIFFPVFTDLSGAAEKCLKAQVECRHLCHMGIGFIQYTVDKPNPLVIRVLNCCPHLVIAFLGHAVSPEFLCEVYHLQKALFPVLFHMRKNLIYQNTGSLSLCLM